MSAVPYKIGYTISNVNIAASASWPKLPSAFSYQLGPKGAKNDTITLKRYYQLSKLIAREYSPYNALDTTLFGNQPTNPIYMTLYASREDGANIAANDLYFNFDSKVYFLALDVVNQVIN